MAAGIAASGVLLLANPALAHVTVTSDSAQPGAAAVLTFHVPNEEAGADTTGLDVLIPTAHPIAQLLVEPVQGWTISVRTTNLATPLVTDDGRFTQVVSEVVWSGGRIAPGQFQDFTLSADPLPQGVSQLTFKAVQTYSNGDVVRWIDVPQAGQPDPDHPAPVLTLTSGAGAAPAATAASSGSDGVARGIAAGGLFVGLLGLAFAALGWRRGRHVQGIEPPIPALNGHGPAAVSGATGPVAEPRAEADRPKSAQPGPEPWRTGARAQGAPKRKGSDAHRGATRR
ncbi:MAG TPA: YcnI family protein [Actinocrinis sp.]|jgi:uncharacterized protein YcnI